MPGQHGCRALSVCDVVPTDILSDGVVFVWPCASRAFATAWDVVIGAVWDNVLQQQEMWRSNGCRFF